MGKSKIIEIKDKNHFQTKLNSEECLILFIFYNWSGYSVMGRKVVESWQLSNNRKIHSIDASKMDYKDYLYKWVANQETGNWSEDGVMTINRFSPKNRIHGYGEILWIKRGIILGFKCVFQSYNVEKLEQRTEEVFE
ncbi:MAG: hypothetical protein ACI9XO_002566 [Paraglaciecola sp.]|jgi:hypothetical protein